MSRPFDPTLAVSVSLLRLSLLFALSLLIVPAVRGDDAKDEANYAKHLVPLLRTYCYDCHDRGSEIDLETDDRVTKLRGNRNRWSQAIAHVRLGTMPPEDGPELDPKTRDLMVRMIDALVNAVDCVNNPNAGRVTLRRLNRAEYRNTIRDLTGVDYKPANDFPGDDVGYGFDNIGDVLSLPPILMEKYADAAESIAGRAIYTPPPPELFEIERSPFSLKGAGGGSDRLTLASEKTVTLETELPFSGMYTLVLSFWPEIKAATSLSK
ncbi:MAG: DUF1587 domain-containing protein [Planctomycetota bacterium]